MSELTNRLPSLPELDIPALAALPERLAEEATWANRFALVDAVLCRLFRDPLLQPDPAVDWAWLQLTRTAGGMPVAALASEIGWSRRHLLTKFHEQLGLPPKTLARVLRFRRTVALLAPGGSPQVGDGAGNLAEIAARCGYADHSHLVREFHALAGCPPTEYLNELRAALS
ncbi:helix-turn-helix domain-containing protein [Tamaricihabitans halophyticus]|nr:helix-turn-helix transcriptional regulator [Tamaricihabitans halophyticus]